MGPAVQRLVSHRRVNCILSHLVCAAAMFAPYTTGSDIIVAINCDTKINGPLHEYIKAALVWQSYLFKTT